MNNNKMRHAKTVRQLIEELSKLPPDNFVVMAEDVEGNYYSPFYKVTTEHYYPINTWSGQVAHQDDYNGMDNEEQSYYIDVSVLWPIN